MWLQFHSVSSLGLQYLQSLGRALALAQSFEENCKYVLLIANLDKEIESRRVNQLSEIQSYSEKLSEWFKLGGAVNQFEFKHKIEAKEIETLRKGKDARNFIAHNAAYPILLGSKSTAQILKDLATYREQVFCLAEAENLISQWSFIIQEKASPPARISSTYTREASDWVLATLAGVEIDR